MNLCAYTINVCDLHNESMQISWKSACRYPRSFSRASMSWNHIHIRGTFSVSYFVRNDVKKECIVNHCVLRLHAICLSLGSISRTSMFACKYLQVSESESISSELSSMSCSLRTLPEMCSVTIISSVVAITCGHSDLLPEFLASWHNCWNKSQNIYKIVNKHSRFQACT